MSIDIVARAMAAGKADLEDGKVPASQLPSYVDDVVEYEDFEHFPSEGEIGKIYVDLSNGYTYRWSGTEYVYVGMTDIDDEMSETSTNPVQNRVITDAIENIKTYRGFKPEWPTNTTLLALLQAVNADADAKVGMAFLGEVTCSGMPFSGNGELTLSIMNKSGSNKVIWLQMSSSNVSPYYWEATYWNGVVTEWRSYMPTSVIGVIQLANASAVSGTLTAAQLGEVSKPLSFIIRGSETFVKSSVSSTETIFKSLNVKDFANVANPTISVVPAKITVVNATGAWTYTE